VLWEVRRQLRGKVGLFSGVEFDVDAAGGLEGVCDYLLTLSPVEITVQAPVVAIAEAKKENIPAGVPQCLAEMVAAHVFNEEAGNTIPCIYGAVTTGTDWKFLRLEGKLATLDRIEYHIDDVDEIVGVLVWMVHHAAGRS
jgi:hypothetical protein